MPNQLICFKQSRKKRSLEKAREALLKEFNIIETIRLQRLIKQAIKTLLPTKTVKELEERSKFTVIDADTPDDVDDEEHDQTQRQPLNLEMVQDNKDKQEPNSEMIH